MNPVTCLDDSLLQMFLERTLDPLERDIVNVHLSTCLKCRQAVSDYKQIMWDLEHPDELPTPAQQAALSEVLMEQWKNRDQLSESGRGRSSSRSLIPAWAGYTVRWTRNMPGVGRLGRIRFKQSPEIARPQGTLRRWLRRRGGGRS